MTIKLTCRTLVITLLLLLATSTAVPDEVGSDQITTMSVGIAEARTLIKGGRFDEALAALRSLDQVHPERNDILFLLGLAAIESARLPDVAEQDREERFDEAIAALRSILINRPDLVRVRLELARAFFLKKEDGLARSHFERVLAGQPPPPVVANIRRFLSEIRARRRWSLYLGGTVSPSTNIGRTSNSEIININGLPFRRDENQLTTSGVGFSIWTGGEYQHPLGERLRLRLGSDAFIEEYSGKEFDQMFLSGHVGPRWLVNRDTEASLLADVRQRWSGSDPRYLDVGTRTEVQHRLNRRTTLTGRASWYRREYRVTEDLDGSVLNASLKSAWQNTPTIRTEAAVGYARERTKRKSSRNATRWGRVGISVALTRGFTLGGSGEFRWTKYEGNWSPFTDGAARKDRSRILRASVYNRGFTLYGFSPRLAVIDEKRKTNAQLHGYKTTSLELRFVRQF